MTEKGKEGNNNYKGLEEYEKLKKEREVYSIFARGGSKDYLAYTVCAGCSSLCGIRVRVVEGCPVSIEGVPESDLGGQGGMCGKGVATIMDYHDPNRCRYPVKRTNPRKGIHEDPKWQRISWEEALNTIAEKIKGARRKDPRSVIWAFSSGPGISLKTLGIVAPFFIVLSPGQRATNGAGICGSTYLLTSWVHATWENSPDYRYCNYLLQCGGNEGFGGARPGLITARAAATARDRGMRLVVMDPIGHIAGGKAQEWVPILPATDSAVFLAMANLIVNEIWGYDKEYIRDKTNGPYLVGPDKLFVRDKESAKPLLWDGKDCTAKTYDDPTLTNPALEGEYMVNGIKCHPAFQLLKDHLKQYDPGWASGISTVPEDTIRRLARELVEAANIGSTIEIEGRKIPYRPAAVCGYKGMSGHSNAWHQFASLTLLNTLLGNEDVAGGIVGSGAARSLSHPETGGFRFEPYAGFDGMLTPGRWQGPPPWPPRGKGGPGLVSFLDIFPYGFCNTYPYSDDWNEIWTKAGRPYEIEVLAIHAANVAINGVNPKSAESFLNKIPFIFSINTTHNETTEGFADIVLPECHNLESLEPFTSLGSFFNYPPGLDKWSIHVRIPVAIPKYERRDSIQIFFDLADRIGIRSELNFYIENYLSDMHMARKRGDVEDYNIMRPEEDISALELTDRGLKYNFGRSLEWFMEHGFMTWKKRPEECYWRYFINARIPIYFETLERDRGKIREMAEKIGIDLDWEQYTALPTYFPSIIYTELPPDSDLDLIAISHRDILHTHRFSAANPFVDEMCSINPYTYSVVMNVETAKKRGIKEGDMICVENHWGDRATGRVKLSQAIHPKVLGTVSAGGGYAKGRPIAQNKGINFNTLMKGDHKHMCPIQTIPEQAVRVKVYKLEAVE